MDLTGVIIQALRVASLGSWFCLASVGRSFVETRESGAFEVTTSIARVRGIVRGDLRRLLD